jgi:serine/threonine protein kinase
LPKRIGNIYTIHEEIGRGKFGVLYKGINERTGEKVAIKLENVNAVVHLLKYETTIIHYLSSKKCDAVPKVFWYGLYEDSFDGEKYTSLIEPFYEGETLFDKIKTGELQCSHCNQIMIQMIQIIQEIHKHGIIYRDIKPHNFIFSSPWNTTSNIPKIYMIDFGLAVFDHSVDELNHPSSIPVSSYKKEHIIGTVNYISYFVHCGYEHSKRDDLISIGYIYLYMISNSLPWFSINTIDTSVETDVSLQITHIEHPTNKYIQQMKQLDKIVNTICNIAEHSGSVSHEKRHCLFAIKQYIEYCHQLSDNAKHIISYGGLIDLFRYNK